MSDVIVSLESDGNSLKEYKNKFKEIYEEVKVISNKKEYLKSFVELTKNIYEIIDKTLDRRIDRALYSKESLPEAVAKELSDLKTLLSKIYFELKNQYISNKEIPRNLYRIIDYFFEECNQKINYIIKFDKEISSENLFQILTVAECDKIYYEFYDELIEKVPNLYIINITHDFKEEKVALKWICIIHEAAHTIDHKNEIIHKFYPNINTQNSEELFYAAKNKLTDYSEKLWAMEYFADYLATWVMGPYYVKVLLEECFTVGNLLKPHFTHPPVYKRIEYLLQLLSQSGFKDKAEIIKKQNEVKKCLIVKGEKKIVVEKMNDIELFIRDIFGNAKFDSNLFNENLKKFGHSEEKLYQDYKEFKPVLLDPPSLLTLIFNLGSEPNPDKEKIEKWNELFSDFIKLYQIKKEFNEKGFASN